MGNRKREKRRKLGKTWEENLFHHVLTIIFLCDIKKLSLVNEFVDT